MKNNAAIISLSFPFAAGVTAAALASVPFEGAIACSVAAAVSICLCTWSNKRCKGLLQLLFFCLGALCWCTDALSPRQVQLSGFEPLADSLEELLDRIPFAGEHSNAIIKALLTGRRSSLPKETLEAFRCSGAAHILALSGLHLGVIYACLRKILGVLGGSSPARCIQSTLTIAACGVYAAATGASPSIVRAFLFIILNEAGRAMSGRAHSPLGTFCLALTIQLAAQPGVISSLAFQLSYLSLLGITVLYPKLEGWYPRTRSRDPLRAVWNSAALSASCQLFTAPLIWLRFRSFPLYFLITNLIALPLTELIIVGAASCAIAEAIWGCPRILATVCGKAVETMEFCLEAISSL